MCADNSLADLISQGILRKQGIVQLPDIRVR